MNSPSESDGIQHAELDWDEQGQPLSRAFGDVYFSRANGLEETRHVFLHHNQLAERFSQLAPGSVFTIGETGFGSGLNFLAAWQLWLATAPAGARLHFVTTEKFPLSRADLRRALALWPELESLAQALSAHYPRFVGRGFHRLIFPQGVTLTLIIADAAAGLEQLLLVPQASAALVDAWFLDGFAPAKNPRMWSDELFNAIAKLSGTGTTAATFSAAGIVKQGLRRAGFCVRKVPGFGRKREMTSAVIEEMTGAGEGVVEAATIPRTGSHDTPADSHEPETETRARPEASKPFSPGLTPWALVRNHRPAVTRTATVIGGGLAGCHSARALAARGWQVTLVERSQALATAASGNPQGVLYAKLSPKQEPLAAFNLASLQFALRTYADFWQRCSAAGSPCGVLQLAHTPAEQQLHERLQPIFQHAEELVQFVSAEDASKLAGIALDNGGLFFPAAGWINPTELCRTLVDHPNIQVIYNTEALHLTPAKDCQAWEVTSHNRAITHSSVVVIANATDARQFVQTAHLPLKNIRGQVSYLPASTTSRCLKTVICSDGYIAPAMPTASDASMHCIGATFNLHDQEPAPRASDHQVNLTKLNQHLPALAAQWSHLDPEQLPGRVAFRCTTPDYLPVVGPAPRADDFAQDYAALRKNAQEFIPLAGSYWPGLYLNAGHGSRGLAYTPLASELLAAHITGEVFPVSRELVHALHPARFLIRSLQRNRL